jgi:hypothetical protein
MIARFGPTISQQRAAESLDPHLLRTLAKHVEQQGGSPRLFWGLVKKPPDEIARIVRHSADPPDRPNTPCPVCSGSGWEDPFADTLVKCHACGGRGSGRS